MAQLIEQIVRQRHSKLADCKFFAAAHLREGGRAAMTRLIALMPLRTVLIRLPTMLFDASLRSPLLLKRCRLPPPARMACCCSGCCSLCCSPDSKSAVPGNLLSAASCPLLPKSEPSFEFF